MRKTLNSLLLGTVFASAMSFMVAGQAYAAPTGQADETSVAALS